MSFKFPLKLNSTLFHFESSISLREAGALSLASFIADAAASLYVPHTLPQPHLSPSRRTNKGTSWVRGASDPVAVILRRLWALGQKATLTLATCCATPGPHAGVGPFPSRQRGTSRTRSAGRLIRRSTYSRRLQMEWAGGTGPATNAAGGTGQASPRNNCSPQHCIDHAVAVAKAADSKQEGRWRLRAYAGRWGAAGGAPYCTAPHGSSS